MESLFDTFVVLGAAIPDGRSVYVLRREIALGRIRDVWLYNAVSGQRFRADDQRCPLRDIGCVFNMENVWANIQSGDLQNMAFDFNNASCWLPMLPRHLQPDFLNVRGAAKVGSHISGAHVGGSEAAEKEALMASQAAAGNVVDDGDAANGAQLVVLPDEQTSWWQQALTVCWCQDEVSVTT